MEYLVIKGYFHPSFRLINLKSKNQTSFFKEKAGLLKAFFVTLRQRLTLQQRLSFRSQIQDQVQKSARILLVLWIMPCNTAILNALERITFVLTFKSMPNILKQPLKFTLNPKQAYRNTTCPKMVQIQPPSKNVYKCRFQQFKHHISMNMHSTNHLNSTAKANIHGLPLMEVITIGGNMSILLGALQMAINSISSNIMHWYFSFAFEFH